MGDHFAPAAEVVAEDLGAELSLYRPSTSEVLVLNQTAADVWRLADGESDTAGIVRLLAQAYATDPVTVRADVEPVLADLTRRGYLVAVNPPAPATGG